MRNIYQVEQDWVQSIPRTRNKRLLRDFLITLVALVIAWQINSYLFVVLLIVGAIYWLSELWSPSKADMEEYWKIHYIEVKDDGLLRVAPNANGTDSISVTSPWKSLRLKSVDRDKDKIKRIKLLDLSMPKGMQTIDIENYKNMGNLLNEIERRVPNDA